MGVFTPYALFFLSLLGPIIWFYLWREKKHVILVSSIIPWSHLSIDQTSDAKAFRIDWQLILQILIVIFCALAIARLYWLQTVSLDYRVLIVDTSASMSARDQDGKIRLDIAKEKALELVDKAGGKTRIALIEVAENAKRLHDLTNDKRKLKQLIKQLTPKQEGTNFSGALNLARSALKGYSGGRIYLLSDGGQWLKEDSSINKQLDIVKIGSSIDNVAITGLDSYQGLYAEKESTVYIRVVNFSSVIKTPRLNIYVGDKLVSRKMLTMPPHAYQNYPFKLRNKKGVLKAELEIDDSLPIDNVAYLALDKGDTFSVLLVTPSDYMDRDFGRLAKATGKIIYDRVFPQDFDTDILKKYRLAIFHQSAPTRLLPIDTLFIAAPPGHGLWKVNSKPVSDVRILDWDRRHPTIKYLDFLDKLPINKAQDVRLPSWGNLLMGTSSLPLAFWGEENGYKQLVYSFDLQTVLFPPNHDVSGIILLLNSLDWLASSEYKGERIKTGEPYRLKHLRKLKEVVVTDPTGNRKKFAPDKQEFYFDQTGYVGVYKIRAVDEDGATITRSFIANLLNENESKLLVENAKESTEKNEEEIAVSEREEPNELWRYLVFFGIIFSFAEWWLYFKE